MATGQRGWKRQPEGQAVAAGTDPAMLGNRARGRSRRGIDVIKPGFYAYSYDVLEHYGFFASGAMNRKGERDLFFTFDFRGRIPGLYQLGAEPASTLLLGDSPFDVQAAHRGGFGDASCGGDVDRRSHHGGH